MTKELMYTKEYPDDLPFKCKECEFQCCSEQLLKTHVEVTHPNTIVIADETDDNVEEYV